MPKIRHLAHVAELGGQAEQPQPEPASLTTAPRLLLIA